MNPTICKPSTAPAQKFPIVDSARFGSSLSVTHSHGSKPRVNLSKGVLLPLFSTAIPQNTGVFDELAHAGRAEAFEGFEFFSDIAVAFDCALRAREFLTSRRQRLDAFGIISNAVVDVVGVLLFETTMERMSLHCK